jgi:hypothetical protein
MWRPLGDRFHEKRRTRPEIPWTIAVGDPWRSRCRSQPLAIGIYLCDPSSKCQIASSLFPTPPVLAGCSRASTYQQIHHTTVGSAPSGQYLILALRNYPNWHTQCVGCGKERPNNSFIFNKKEWCPGWESNAHEEKSPEDFKSLASAILPAGRASGAGCQSLVVSSQ